MKLKKLLLLALSLMLVVNLSVIATEEDDEDNEVDLTSAVITAISCAKQAEESGEFAILSSCPPHKAFEGIPADKIYTASPKVVIFDVTEGEFYLVQPNEYLTYSDLLEGFGGSLDGTGVIVGEKDGVPVIKFEEEVTVTPKPKPGFFKGCL